MLFPLFALVAVQIGVGFWAARRIRTEDDFLLAGRRLGPGLAAASMFATWFGAESCIGAAGEAYARGVSPATTEPFAYGACLILMGLFFAKSLWERRITTLADFFRQRFGPRSERLAAVLLLPSSLLWAAAQIRAFGHVVATNANGLLGIDAAIAIGAGVAIVYTVSGGLLADVYTDVLQGALLIVGLVVLALFVYTGVELRPPPAPTAAAIAEAPGFWTIVENWAQPICGSIVAQEAISRALAARSGAVARAAAVGGGSLYLLVGLIPLTLGAFGPRLLPGLADGEELLPRLSREVLPPALNLLFASALIAAILSTVDSCLLVVSSIIARNLVAPAPATPPDGEPARGRLGLARIAAAAAGVCAYGFASSDWQVHDLVEEASGFGSAGVFLLAALGTYSRAGGPLTADATLLAGLIAWLGGRWLLAGQIEHPYLLSLATAAAAMGVALSIEHRRKRRRAG